MIHQVRGASSSTPLSQLYNQSKQVVQTLKGVSELGLIVGVIPPVQVATKSAYHRPVPVLLSTSAGS